jgi:hypothetical protein
LPCRQNGDILSLEAAMLTLALRDFQRQGGKALQGRFYEPFLLQGRDEEFVALRVPRNVPMSLLDELMGFAAVMALRENQARAVETGLDQMTMKDVEAEIKAARAERKQGKRR